MGYSSHQRSLTQPPGVGLGLAKKEGFVNLKAVIQIAPRTPSFGSHPRDIL